MTTQPAAILDCPPLPKSGGMMKLMGKGAWAITDQALFAGSNFIMNIVLARPAWLSEHAYGAFSVAFAVFLLIGTVHTSLLTEPMIVFGSGRYREKNSEYLGLLIYGHLAFVLPCSVILLITGLIMRNYGTHTLSQAMIGLSVAGPMILFLWLMRRACYLRMEPALAAWGGLLYMVLMLGGLWMLSKLRTPGGEALLRADTALGVMGISSLIVGLWLMVRLHASRPHHVGEFMGEVLQTHWDYGRWACGTQAVLWAQRNIYYLILPASKTLGLAESGALRAMMNLTLPLTQATTALAILLIPVLVKARKDGTFERMMFLSLSLFTVAGALYGLFLGMFHYPIVSVVYHGNYIRYSYLLWIVGSSLLFGGVVDVLGAGLRALERPDQMFWSNIWSTVIALSIGLACLAYWGVMGAAIGLTVSSAIKAAAMWVFYRRLLKKGPVQAEGAHAVDA
jgi:O-antigen/teichoic acid export membrane protein